MYTFEHNGAQRKTGTLYGALKMTANYFDTLEEGQIARVDIRQEGGPTYTVLKPAIGGFKLFRTNFDPPRIRHPYLLAQQWAHAYQIARGIDNENTSEGRQDDAVYLVQSEYGKDTRTGLQRAIQAGFEHKNNRGWPYTVVVSSLQATIRVALEERGGQPYLRWSLVKEGEQWETHGTVTGRALIMEFASWFDSHQRRGKDAQRLEDENDALRKELADMKAGVKSLADLTDTLKRMW